MRQFVESLKRLYKRNIVDKDKIDSLWKDGKITVKERDYILS